MTVSNYHIIPKLAVVDARESDSNMLDGKGAKVNRANIQFSNFPAPFP